MSLSNTATPKYFAEFREKVLAREIPVNREVSMQMCLIEDLVANPRFYYDDEAIDGYIRFCENELVLTDGTPMRLLPSFKLWAEDLLGWFYFTEKSVYDHKLGRYVTKKVKKRLRNKQFLILGRGGAKTMYSESIHAYILVVDKQTTQQIVTAPTVNQAEETVLPLITAITVSRGPVFKLLTSGSIMNTTGKRVTKPKLVSTKKGIQNFLTNSIIKIIPMRIDKLQGYRPKMSSVDEWLSGDIRENVINAIEQGASKNENWIIVATSSEGTVRNSVGDDLKLELASILKGDYYDPHVSIWYYKLDDVSEVSKPNMWLKANPNLGYTVSYETYAKEVEHAEKVPSSRNDTLAKRFGIPTEGFTYYFTYEETLPHKSREFWRMWCSMGCDMSQGDDFCSFTFLFPLSVGFGVKNLSFITDRTLSRLGITLRNKYEDFIEEGSLRVLEGSSLDMKEVYDEVIEYIATCQYTVRCVGYDPYNAEYFVDRWSRERGSYGVTMVRQGSRTESVPLGELKHLAEDRLLFFDQMIMKYTMGNAITLNDTNGNRKLYRKRADQKVDCVAAMLDAYVAWKVNETLFE